MKMKSRSLVSNDPILQKLQKCYNLNTLKQAHAHVAATGLSFQKDYLRHLLNISSKFSSTYAITIFNRIPSPTLFLYNNFIFHSLVTRTKFI
ncbi:hypothetical protein VIGAN_08049400 [Vigna angularis var. angularis]|uniref:Uncharacterized protein n=1 Tax=Vigna angularis var. angularis TaxID=157739 RepID=A0A0S3SM62_PHAAN|nr:hypothetical protein VIGAN_08049400 [Vigna angularis var. angularis]